MSRGLQVFSWLLANSNRQDEIFARELRHCFSGSSTYHQLSDPPMQKALTISAQHYRRIALDGREHAGAVIRDIAEKSRMKPILILEASKDVPPYAWIELWRDRYANVYGEHVPRRLRQCGYVMWDPKRWPDERVVGFLATQWTLHEGPMLGRKIQSLYGWHPLYDGLATPPLYIN